MRDDPQSILSTSRIQSEASAMLLKRNICGEDEPWDVSVDCLWSFRRGEYHVLHVIKANKEIALSLTNKECRIIVIYNDCTPAANKIFKSNHNVEAWRHRDLCMHPFHFSFIVDAGIETRPYPADAVNYPKILPEDPVFRYLGASRGDVIWIKSKWGNLGMSKTLRYAE